MLLDFDLPQGREWLIQQNSVGHKQRQEDVGEQQSIGRALLGTAGKKASLLMLCGLQTGLQRLTIPVLQLRWSLI